MRYLVLGSDLNITLNLHDIFLSLLYISLIILVFVIIGVFVRLFQTATVSMKILKANGTSISEILTNTEVITKNAGVASEEIAHAVQVMRPTVDNVADTAEDITDTIKNNNPVNEAIITAYKTVNNANKFVSSVKEFGKDKK
ncbi:MAG: hypothetical protein CSB15_00600 [Clostridiales bacterium]|nr:MAG: hypothetical protein CSB15_00600 [Clostridiales bacterium]